MNSRADAEVADTLDVDVRALVLAAAAILSVLDGNLGKADTDGTDIASQNVATVEGLAGPHGVVQTLEVDWKSMSTTGDLTKRGKTLTETTVLVRQDTRRLDRSVRAEHAEDRSRRRRGGDRPDPQSTGRGRLQLRIHTRQAHIVAAGLAKNATRGRSDRAVEVGTLRGSDGGAVRFTEPDAHGLAVGHADVPAKAVQDVILRTDGIGLVDEVDEAALLPDEGGVVMLVHINERGERRS